mgnify:CR=1 FL=1
MNLFNANAAFEPGDKEHRFARTCASCDGAAQDGVNVFVGVIRFPGASVRGFPFGLRHVRVSRNGVIQVVFIQIRIHRDARFVQAFVIFGTGQRRQVKKFEQVNRQLFLDDFDVANDGFGRVIRKAENVAAIRDDADFLPCQQHFSVIRDAILTFARARTAPNLSYYRASFFRLEYSNQIVL